MSVNMYSGYPQLAFNFSKNFSARMHRSSLGKTILKLYMYVYMLQSIGVVFFTFLLRYQWSEESQLST